MNIMLNLSALPIKCPFTCCREWKIEVDDESNEKWKKLQAPEGVYPVRKNMSNTHKKRTICA